MRALALACLLLAGCGLQDVRPLEPGYSGTTADGVSTFIAAAAQPNGTEIGPLAGAVPLWAGVPITVGLRWVVVQKAIGEPHCSTVVNFVDSIGIGAACSNISVALGWTGYGPLILLPACAIPYALANRDNAEEHCNPSCRLEDLPPNTISAQCDAKGRIIAVTSEA